MPLTTEQPNEPENGAFGEDDLQYFPEVDSVKETQGVLDVAVKFQDFHDRTFRKHLQSNFKEAYDTRGNPRGLCLIINNKEFLNHADRSGTDTDCKNLRRLFKQLGYSVTTLHNQTADQMKTECQNFIFDPKHADYSSCVLAILSHGTMDKILGSDSKPIDEKVDILNCFNSEVCKLRGKPKLVIVQACRTQLETRNRESQYEYEGGDGTDGPAPEKEEYLDLVDRMCKLNYKDARSVENSLTPDFADLMIAHSTLPGYVSWRHTECGSWFVQSIVQIFSRNFSEEHVADMLVQVSQLISDAFGQNERCQMPCPINHLRKKFYFFPNRQ